MFFDVFVGKSESHKLPKFHGSPRGEYFENFIVFVEIVFIHRNEITIFVKVGKNGYGISNYGKEIHVEL